LEYGDKVALVAAGGTGDDTRRAGIVLNQYKTYALSGTEASVAGTDFTNIQVSKVQ
jgi:ribose/xylose/arabinose/galactoside ABC-type transport system permease subunit